jgi:DNA invertase Pin-like site-specific DNA recombinase
MIILPYIRVSTDDQENSMDMQLATIKRYCTQNDYTMGAVFADEDVSAYKEIGRRPQGARLLKELAVMKSQGKEVGVVSIKVDRMFRNSIDALVTVKNWNTQEIPLFIVAMGGNSLNTITSVGWLFFQTLVMFAEFERNQISERTRDVKRHLKDTYRKNGIIPYGWVCNDGDNLLQCDEEFAVVREVFSQREQGKTLADIAGYLNESGARTKSNSEFKSTTISRILSYEPNIRKIREEEHSREAEQV